MTEAKSINETLSHLVVLWKLISYTYNHEEELHDLICWKCRSFDAQHFYLQFKAWGSRSILSHQQAIHHPVFKKILFSFQETLMEKYFWHVHIPDPCKFACALQIPSFTIKLETIKWIPILHYFLFSHTACVQWRRSADDLEISTLDLIGDEEVVATTDSLLAAVTISL